MSNLNDITGDRIITKQSCKYADNFDAIFRKDKTTESSCTGDCNQGRNCNCKTTKICNECEEQTK